MEARILPKFKDSPKLTKTSLPYNYWCSLTPNAILDLSKSLVHTTMSKEHTTIGVVSLPVPPWTYPIFWTIWSDQFPYA
jgi:hypothetical protein